jgi:hypothetical protein
MSETPQVEWYRSRGLSGSDLGLAFRCFQCGLLIAHSAPEQIDHCRIFSYAPPERDREALPTRRVGSGFVGSDFGNLLESPGWKDDPRAELDNFRQERERETWL